MEQRFSDLIILLASGINQRRMYFDDHPKVRAFAADFTVQLRKMLGEEEVPEFSFGVYNGKFIRNGKYLVGPSIAGRSLIAFAEHLGCGGFVFTLPLEPEDLISFFRLGALTKEEVHSLDQARSIFEAQGIGHVQILEPYGAEGDGSRDPAEQDDTSSPARAEDFMAAEFAPLVDIYQALYEIVARNGEMCYRGGEVDIDRARTQGERLIQITDHGAMDVMQFMRYPDYDSYTIGHSVRVAALAGTVARAMGFPEEVVSELATAGLLHDLGKGKVPEEILFKPGKLDKQERAVIESHPVLGAEVLVASGGASELMVCAAWGHHLRHDGGGYPRMPEWHERSQAASIIHVCDIFEALTATRPYKDPMSPLLAYQIMLRDLDAFAPGPLAALIRAIGIYPPGSEVRLSDGRMAVVVAPGASLESPRIRVTHTVLGEPLAQSVQPLVNLDQEPELDIEEFLLVGVGRPEDRAVLNSS